MAAVRAGSSGDFLDDDEPGLVINASKSRETSYGTSSLSQPPVVDSNDWIKARFVVGFMGFLGLALVYAMRVNLSVVIVAMVNNTKPPDDINVTVPDACPGPSGPAPPPPKQGEFDWDARTQGIILGSFFYGYVLTQVPGGRLAEQYGAKTIFGWGIFITAIFTLLSPPAARMGEGVFIFVRVLEGLGEGVTFPSMVAMLARWIPPLERNTFAAAVYSGSNFGTIISMPLSGYLASVEWMGGWPLAFYVFGGLGVIWCVVWWQIIFDSPSTHPRISAQEREYILASLGPENSQDKDDSDFPWVDIFCCVPFWAIMVSQCGMAWAFYTQLTEMPTYMAHILKYSLQANAVLTSIPYLTSWISSLLFCRLADWLIEKEYLSPVASMKIFNSLASVVPSIGFIGAALAGCDRQLVMVIISLTGAFVGAQYAGNQMNHIALSPRYAGTMYGMTNGVANLCGFLAPYTIGSIINNHETVGRWQLVFFLAAAVNIITNLVYIIFGSAKEQPFNHPNPKPSYLSETWCAARTTAMVLPISCCLIYCGFLTLWLFLVQKLMNRRSLFSVYQKSCIDRSSVTASFVVRRLTPFFSKFNTCRIQSTLNLEMPGLLFKSSDLFDYFSMPVKLSTKRRHVIPNLYDGVLTFQMTFKCMVGPVS